MRIRIVCESKADTAMKMALLLCYSVAGLLPGAAAAAAGSKPHIVSILQDDLGYADTGIHNPAAAAWTANITALAKEGIVLTNHYSHWHCSPTRRSFLTGRLPIHHGEQLSGDATDDIDLRMDWVSDKLHAAGYQSHWFGKWHTGFKSMGHLGFEHGFTSAVGSFQTGGPYSGPGHSMRWQDDHPIWSDAQFEGMPGPDANRGGRACNATGGGPDAAYAAAAATCANSSVLPDTNLQCGEAIIKQAAASATACCASCRATTGCTHWVFHPWEEGTACHIKGGKTCAGSHEKGSTAGILDGGMPGPPGPAGPATCTNEYSTDLWGRLALQAVEQHPLPTPLYVHLCFEAVHTPYDKAPGDPTGVVYRGLVWRADVYVGALVAALKARQMWDTTLVVYSADNGGVGGGINYPLRGEKHSNWEGGMRTAAFVSGGLIPAALRGTTNGVTAHVVDWWPTFAVLAGTAARDDPPTPPLAGDHADPYRNIYGEASFPPLDGVDLWPLLTEPGKHAIDAAHAHLVLTKEVLIAANYKLLVAQPYFKSQNNGWKDLNGTWSSDNGGAPPMDCVHQTLSPAESFFPVPHNASLRPCLFDIRKDPSERHNVAAQFPAIVEELWAALNATLLTQRDCSGWSYRSTPGGIPGPMQADPKGNTTGCSPPALLGVCARQCAGGVWSKFGDGDGPICGVPGCT
jgi:arylsulfatase A-like enzyme